MSPTWTVRSRARATPEKRLPERLLQGEADDRRDDGRGGEQGREAGGERHLKEDAEREAEENEADDLPQEVAEPRSRA